MTTIRDLYKSITGITNPLQINLSSSHSSATATATIVAESTSLGIGDSIEVDIGYTTNHRKMFTGYVKQIERNVPEDTYTVTAHDVLSRAVDYFIVSSNPDNPFSRQNIAAELFIRDLIALAGLTNYTYDATSFIYAVSVPAEVNLVGCYDYAKSLADLLAWHLWADENGLVHFEDRKPYVMGGDSPSGSITDSTIIRATYTESDDDLRNRVVVYGANNLVGEASAVSPYLPAGFYKSVVLATQIIDTQANVNAAANYNLAMLNRLKTGLQIEAEGYTPLLARDVATITQSNLGISSENWYVYSAEHTIDQNGYITNLELRK